MNLCIDLMYFNASNNFFFIYVVYVQTFNDTFYTVLITRSSSNSRSNMKNS